MSSFLRFIVVWKLLFEASYCHHAGFGCCCEYVAFGFEVCARAFDILFCAVIGGDACFAHAHGSERIGK